MIPQRLEACLRGVIPEAILQKRTRRKDGRCHLVLDYRDEHLLARMGIVCDALGPKLVAFMWDETSADEIGGYLVVDNLAMGAPSMGGIRMLAAITPADIHNLARGMTLKNAAAQLPFGGGKAGILADPTGSPEQHTRVIRGFARLLRRYRPLYVPGPDVGSNDADMKTIAVENGLDAAVSKPAEMGGNRIDELGAAAGGVVIALERLIDLMPRLTVLSQFAQLKMPAPDEVTVLIQGFGAVGAHAARLLRERLPAARVVGISDVEGHLFCPAGLPVEDLFALWKQYGQVTGRFFGERIQSGGPRRSVQYSTDTNNLLRESAFCFVPAAPVFNYLGVLPSEKCSMSVERMGAWSLIVEGANTYSPDPNRKAARTRMEQVVYRQKGVMIATDYLVNSGGVIFAAQEQILPTPPELRIPEAMLGNHAAVEVWLREHATGFARLSEKRLEAGAVYREKAIRRNMTELVDLLASNADLLPSQAAERISVRRLAERESERTAKDIMEPMPMVPVDTPLTQVAALIVQGRGNIIAVLDGDERLVGVVTTWDITRAVAEGTCEGSLEAIMTKRIISAGPAARIPDIVRELEQNRISAMPVVEEGRVLGMVSSDLLAQRYLPQLLRAQDATAGNRPTRS
ncbi:MAG: CBS domain-containing protein [Desulfobacterales bacterium]|jgi:glutamate dehydrogenase (NAD(P)+)|nr:CBS domain-containing protein [Desulfobacterales bacterium]